ncbi:hypothetical protein BGZ61DRAFT_476244 [Ilyonectria robusta]|uniref:uncharacterized protein n=1 Tax=Ilyonectria robusta TaxID=1079257 RepID=UPI001E8D3BC4|nr:uncharacterized protein BGZ61DRAFT_476244 [Ilyonectria robusta]KAH8714129.1 hypothetical protein BGZ61DRAFT_476244 [Ilyonectria robusta]
MARSQPQFDFVPLPTNAIMVMSMTKSLEALSKGNMAVMSAQPPAITCSGSSEPALRNEVHTQTPLPVSSPSIPLPSNGLPRYGIAPVPQPGQIRPPEAPKRVRSSATVPRAQFTEGFLRRTDRRALNRTESAKRSPNPLASHRPSKVTKTTRPKPFPNTSPLSNPSQIDAATFAALQNQQNLREPVSPTNWEKAAIPPAPPSASQIIKENGCLRWQIRMARHLAQNGHAGPFEIGDFLCDINRITGKILKIASRVYNPDTGYFWRNMFTGGRIHPQNNNKSAQTLCGKPVAGPGGAFLGFADDNGGIIQPQIQLVSPDREAILCPEPDFKSALRNGQDPMWF